MGKAVRYQVVEVSANLYQLSHGSLVLCQFCRQTLRDSLEASAFEHGFSSNWVGSMVRIFRKKFPLPFTGSVRSAFDRFVDKLGGPEGVANYYRSKGFRIVKKVPFSDLEGIRYLEKEGFEVFGITGDILYASK